MSTINPNPRVIDKWHRPAGDKCGECKRDYLKEFALGEWYCNRCKGLFNMASMIKEGFLDRDYEEMLRIWKASEGGDKTIQMKPFIDKYGRDKITRVYKLWHTENRARKKSEKNSDD